MTKIFFLIFILLLSSPIHSQENVYQSENFNITFHSNKLTIHSVNDSLIFERECNNAYILQNDLDADGNSEIILIEYDSTFHFGFIVYVFNTLDDFFLVDSILAGRTEPVIVNDVEIQYNVIVCGNPDFEVFFSDSLENYEPINIWKFAQGELYLANEELYELFIIENENLVNLLTYELGNKIVDCPSIKPYLSLLATVYANFQNAGETASAIQVIDRFYKCDDKDFFKQTIDELLFIKEN